MGSFNETCALSGLTITPGDKVKLVFLSESPYRRTSRGCYINDHYVLRTPPISGEYADYGKCEFDESQPVVKLVVDKFREELVEQPFGFNQYHDPPTPADATIHQLLEAAWEGRLQVRDNLGTPEDREPEGFPTWRRVRDKLIAKKKKIQLGESDKAYNVQQVRYGVVCVHFNSYDDNKKKMETVDKFLSKDYETKLVRERPDSGDWALLVMPKGVSENPSMLLERETNDLHWAMNNYPDGYRGFRAKNQNVIAVMIREDVWNLFLNSKFEITWRPTDYTLQGFIDRLNKHREDYEPKVEFAKEELDAMTPEEAAEASMKMLKWMRISMNLELRDVFQEVTGVTSLAKHFTTMLDGEYTEEEQQDFVRIFAEAAKVEFTKMGMSAAWYAPITSGQGTPWETFQEIHTGIAAIAAEEQRKYDEEYGEYEDDEDDDDGGDE